MSYSIVYAREFLKTNDGRIIPLVLSGCNNCYEMYNGRERRERCWWTLYIPRTSSPAVKPEELMGIINSRVPSDNEHFIRGGKWVDDKAFVRFYENGIKKAKTLEELNDEAVCSVRLEAVITTPRGEDDIDTVHRSFITNSEELDVFLDFVDEYILKHSGEKYVISIFFNREDPIKRKTTKKRNKVFLEENYYVVKMEDNYVTQLTPMRLRCSPYVSAAKRFPSERIAWKWIKDRELERRYSKFKFDVEYVA